MIYVTTKVIGIIGGMGPEATVDFMSKVIKATPAKIDQDHIRLLVDNNPKIPSRVDAILKEGQSPSPVMAQMAKDLESWGAEVLAIPCNTAHYYIEDVIKAVHIPVLNMVEETVKVIQANGLKEIALLATSATIKTKLYEARLAQESIKIILPNEEYQEKTMEAISAVKSGDYPLAYQVIEDVILHIQDRGAQGIILGCTELPLIITEKNCSLIIFDPTEILAKSVVANALSLYAL